MDRIDDMLIRARELTRDAVAGLVEEETERFLGGFADPRQPSDVSLAAAASACRRRLLDTLLGRAWLDTVSKAAGAREVDRGALAQDIRRAALPLEPQPPEPRLEVRPSGLALAACLGAVAGVFGLTPLTRLLLGYQEVGLIIGGPLGAWLFVLGASYLSHDKALLRTLQAALGVAALVDVALIFSGGLSPVRLLWRHLWGGAAGGGLLAKLKLLALFIAGTLVLQCAAPVASLHHEQLRRNVAAAIRAWLRHHVDLVVVLLAAEREEPAAAAQAAPAPLLRALAKLAAVRDDATRADVAAEVLQEFRNAGYDTPAAREEDRFRDSLRTAYEVVGLIAEGDPYRVLEAPVEQDGRVLVKGRLTRVRKSS